MTTQKTDALTIENEKQIIANVAGLSDLRSIVLHDRGWDSRVYSFHDGRYFFKFPRSKKVQQQYRYEIAVIEHLADRKTTGVVTPNIRWKHPKNAYFGYEGVHGSPVSEIIQQLDTVQKQSVGTALGNFLKQLHGLQLPEVRTMSTDDESQQIQRWHEQSKPTIPKYFTNAEQQRLHQLVYEIWPTTLAKLGSESVLCHGDLHFENVLYGHDGSVGVIDFGDVAYYDRSKDFIELLEDKTIFDAVQKTYGHMSQSLMQKITIRHTMIQVINLGFHAGKKDTHGMELTVEKIKAGL